ncbi:hypothetical protein ACIBCC_29845 [Streptomyces griseus]|uniref:hypothetical protein n=1 Tax=Streptomyces griseus TaxID=1911 RepID=UPI003792FCD5
MPSTFFDLDPTVSRVTLPVPPPWHSLYGLPDQAAVRPLRARDVRPGDRWVGSLDTARFHDRSAPLERLRGYWGYEFTADPVGMPDDRIQLCVWRGEPQIVDADAWTLVVPRCRPVPPPRPPREWTVTWRAEFEADSPREAARLACEQLRSYAERGTWPPVLDVAPHGGETVLTIELNEEAGRMGNDSSPGQDWRSMRRADFDPDAPLALVDPDTVAKVVPAVPDQYGTEALFGDAPAQRRPRREPAPDPVAEIEPLF